MISKLHFSLCESAETFSALLGNGRYFTSFPTDHLLIFESFDTFYHELLPKYLNPPLDITQNARSLTIDPLFNPYLHPAHTFSFHYPLPIGAVLGNPVVGVFLPGTLRDRQRRFLEMERLSLWCSAGGTWSRASLLGTLELHQTGQGRLWKCRDSVRATWRAGSYTEDSERHVTGSYGNGIF